MRKILCLLLCLVMTFGLMLPAYAEETTGGDTPPVTEHTHSWAAGTPAPATCTQAGSTPYSCSCGATKTEPIAALGHSYGSWTQVDAVSHKRVCGTCGNAETSAHSLTTNSTNTCTAAGVKTTSCSVCGYSATETAAATGVHDYGEWTKTAESHSHTCGDCGKVESGNHSFTTSVTQAATCKDEGKQTKTCGSCGYSLEETIPKLTTHTYDNTCDDECNVCGAIRTVIHDLESWWSKDGSGHWHTCKKCKFQGNFGKHFPGPAATEEKAQICLTCGYTMTARLNHTHEYEDIWTADESGHWYGCSGCEEQKDYQAHDYDDQCDPDCNICGYKTGNAHVFDGTWHSDEEGHWFVCTVCGGVAESRAHVLNPDVAETEDQYCADCGYLVPGIQGHTHTYEGQFAYDESGHWTVCPCGERSPVQTHVWDAGTEKDGLITYTCNDCGAVKTEAASEAETEDLPWDIIFGVLVALLIAAVVALILVLKPAKKKKAKR